jgi:hypothetical protein
MDYGKQCDFIFFSINKKDIDDKTLWTLVTPRQDL